MNKKLSMAVAGAVMAFGASAANAGITIPAGDWTIDIGGNVNAYYTHTSFSGDQESSTKGTFTDKSANTVQTGLLPSALGVGGKTRQNDLDVAFQFTFFTGVDSGSGQAFGNNTLNIRQAFLSFGDKSWGTIKAGRDLGIFASDAILSDMTLLGVGAGAGQGGTTTLGRIGNGYQYADWKGQITYISPNWNGFDFAAGITENFNNAVDGTNANLGYEGKVGYSWAGDVSGKVWSSFVSQKHEGRDAIAAVAAVPGNAGVAAAGAVSGYTTRGIDVGAKVNVSAFGLVGYYYDGRGLSGGASAASGLKNLNLNGGVNFLGTDKTDDKGGYVQGTFVVPGVGTKLGLSYGVSKSDADTGSNNFENKSWIVGAYHPLTKSLNLVAEYTDNKIEGTNANGSGTDNIDLKARTVALGAILFF